MKIRKATLKDLKRIDEIYVEGSIDEGKYQFPNVSAKEMKKDLRKKEKERLKGWRRDMKSKKHYWIVAEEKNQIKGFGQAWLKRKDKGIVESVYVNKKYRRKRIGKKIISELINWLKKNKMKYIESGIYLKNKPSIKLHKKSGFKPISLTMRLK